MSLDSYKDRRHHRFGPNGSSISDKSAVFSGDDFAYFSGISLTASFTAAAISKGLGLESGDHTLQCHRLGNHKVIIQWKTGLRRPATIAWFLASVLARFDS